MTGKLIEIGNGWVMNCEFIDEIEVISVRQMRMFQIIQCVIIFLSLKKCSHLQSPYMPNINTHTHIPIVELELAFKSTNELWLVLVLLPAAAAGPSEYCEI